MFDIKEITTAIPILITLNYNHLKYNQSFHDVEDDDHLSRLV